MQDLSATRVLNSNVSGLKGNRIGGRNKCAESSVAKERFGEANIEVPNGSSSAPAQQWGIETMGGLERMMGTSNTKTAHKGTPLLRSKVAARSIDTPFGTISRCTTLECKSNRYSF